MKRVVFMLMCLLAAPAVRGDLASDISSVMADKELQRANIGIDIVRLGKSAGDSTTIFQNDCTSPLIPASNLKVITTSAAAQQKLGPDFKFRTQLIWHDGDLVLLGDGDPTFGDAEMLKKVGWDCDTVFNSWAVGLTKRGITSINDLVVDDSIF